MPRPPYIERVCALPTEKFRRWNSSIGTAGAGVRRSCATKRPSSTMPASPGPHTCGLLQLVSGSRISASTGPARPKNVSVAPSQSTGACAAPRSRPGTARLISTSVRSTNGTLMAKISRQETASTR